CSSYAGNNVFF
nr:immunoglobulin light chain junction region [Macaca mulatta]MPO04050.1 immunoglobulin light chain junction region [Macaca mulatta]MPO05113.1 immunoglobulin light chain junction region [Macaca mulatta]MPO07094.1 immunoglobulin light chain junction region [Macaca mulatta]MPO07568.1 immunoglobulin light chain junction region [Macaca mulatta]